MFLRNKKILIKLVGMLVIGIFISLAFLMNTDTYAWFTDQVEQEMMITVEDSVPVVDITIETDEKEEKLHISFNNNLDIEKVEFFTLGEIENPTDSMYYIKGFDNDNPIIFSENTKSGSVYIEFYPNSQTGQEVKLQPSGNLEEVEVNIKAVLHYKMNGETYQVIKAYPIKIYVPKNDKYTPEH